MGIGIFFAIAIPAFVFFGGVWFMRMLAGSSYTTQLLSSLPAADRKPLNQRWGYDVDQVDRHWQRIAKDENAMRSECRFLKFDLLFPFFYCGAFMVSLAIVTSILEHSWTILWMLAILLILSTLLSDLAENILQLSQLRQYVESGKSGLSAKLIQMASLATKLKLSFFFATCGLILLMCLAALVGL